jgi:EAL domain-containing protein (putative c-di-GMP-specific phosphodiesterase class I)
LDNKHFKVYFQPIVDSATGRIVSAEALVRWQDPVYGLIAPADFVPLFEKNGFVYDMDRYVWQTVCENISTWKRAGLTVPPISLNVSRVDLLMDDLEESLYDLLMNYNLTLQDIKLEITEGAFQLEDGERALRRVEKLHDEGFTILMDDFGSGYSNFNNLKKIPVDVLKADMKFLEKGGDTKKGDIVIRSIVDMTKRLQIPMIVEGVETLEDVNYLAKLDCEMFQGFYFFKPLERSTFEEVLRKNSQ